MTKVGDTVRYLNAVGGGKVIRIENNIAWVDDQGFETPVLIKECVVVRSAEEDIKKISKETDTSRQPSERPYESNSLPAKKAKFSTPAYTEEEDEVDMFIPELPDGDNIKVVMGFEPVERTSMSTTDFNLSFINDSNYYLHFTVLNSSSDEGDLYNCLYSGTIEPDTDLWLGTIKRDTIATLNKIVVQYVAYKKGKPFKFQEPVSVKLKIDNSKFFKLHCFQKSEYFDDIALVFNVTDQRSKEDTINISDLKSIEHKSIQPQQKKQDSSNSKNLYPLANKKAKLTVEPLVIDLHINELVDNTRGMSSADMLNMQIDKFREIMDANLKNYGRKIIFIHGKGEGVLRQAINKELNHRYKGHDYRDASFAEYGYGATQVTIKQNLNMNKR